MFAVPAFASAARLVTISGATASYPLVTLLAQKYVKTHKHRHQIKLQDHSGRRQVGINDVAAGRVTIGDVSRDPIASDQGKNLYFYPIARYEICVVTNPSNPVSTSPRNRSLNIFTGVTKNWSEVPGASAERADQRLQPHLGGRRADELQDPLLEGKSVTKSATETASEGLMKQAVKNNPTRSASSRTTRSSSEASTPRRSKTSAAVKANVNTYPGVARFYEVTKGAAEVPRMVHLLDRPLGRRSQDHQHAMASPDRANRRSAAMLERLRRPWPDSRAERLLGAVSLRRRRRIVAMVVFVVAEAWPIFEHNGLGWLFSEQAASKARSRDDGRRGQQRPGVGLTLHAWPIIYGTLLTSGIAVVLGVFISVLASIFIVEIAHAPLKTVMIPVIRLLASVPSVLYGLIGILVIVPFVGNQPDHRTERSLGRERRPADGRRPRRRGADPDGDDHADHGRADQRGADDGPPTWKEGAVALGLNPLRAVRAVHLKAIRPAIAAAVVLAGARAVGEAIMIQMVSGGKFFSPKPIDGLIFFYEPLRTLASTIVDFHEGIGAPPLRAALYAFAAAAAVRRARVVGRRLSREAAPAALPGARMSAVAPIRAARSGPALLAGHWRWSDRIVLVLAWAIGLGLCAVAASIVIYMGVRGLQYLSPELVFSHPQVSASQAGSGGFLDPLLGTLILTVIGTLVGRPSRSARYLDRRVRTALVARPDRRVEHRGRRGTPRTS